MSEITIRDVRSMDDYKRSIEVQKEVWGLSDLDVVPVVELITVQHYGGLCAGAFDGNDMVGFVYGMVGHRKHRFFHHSHMLAVLPSYRGRRVGTRLKWAQRARVLRQGMDLVNWTFDPLQAPNAKLNIRHLGVTINKYVENIYGETESPLHGGIPTDRLEAEWWLESARVLRAQNEVLSEEPDWEELCRINQTGMKDGFLHCENVFLDCDEADLLVEIPGDIASIMAGRVELALDWRMKTRQLFQNYFSRGYTVTDFHHTQERAFYHLRRESS